MKLENKFATDLTSKDKNIAQEAAKHILTTPDLEAWKCFVENSDNIFDFIKQNIAKYFSNIIDETNYKNLFELFKIHSFDWDECFIQILLRFSYANDELTNKMLELIEKGSEDEKAYAAKYFSFIPNERANYFLFDAYSINYEPLKYNAARALGDAGDFYSYNYYTNKLSATDDWEKIDAAQFLQWYGNKKAYLPLLNAMKDSAMPEHIAGSIAMLEDIYRFFNADDKTTRDLSLDCYQYLIDSLAEIWPLSTILDFELYNCVETLIALINENADKGLTTRLATLLLRTKYQLEIFNNNDEYKFNENKNTLAALEEIIELLNEGNDDFWQKCISHMSKELSTENPERISYAIDVISNLELKDYAGKIKEILNGNYPQEVIYKAALATETLSDFSGIEKETVLSKIQDENIKALLDKIIN